MKLKTIQTILVTMILVSSVALTGCSQPSNNTSTSTVSNTVLNPITPTGNLQGLLIDAVTQQPIVGAVIDIGLAIATTNQDGQFVLMNMPATEIGTGAAAGTTLTGTYEMSINLKGVTSPVNMADATIKNRYPDFSFKSVKVLYTSDVGHPLTGVAKGYQFSVGKLSATVTGEVTDVNGVPKAGYNVTLYSAVNAQNSSTGNTGQGGVVVPALDPTSGHVVATTSTNASGQFTIANIEAGANFTVAAQDTAFTMFGERAFTAPADTVTTASSVSATRTLSFQNGDAVVVSPTDLTPPKVVTVTPEHLSDNTAGATSVVFTFSEPIKQTGVAGDVSPSNPSGLYSLVDVNFMGPKALASNLAHTLSWNATFTQLTVALTTGASSLYTVDISRAVPFLQDNAGNFMVAAVAPVTGIGLKQTVSFTTNGGPTAAAPTIAITNSASINATSTTTGAPVVASLNWLPTSGAKGYNIYRTMNEVWGATTIAHPPVKLNATALFVSNYTDAFTDLAAVPLPADYVEYGSVKQTYSYHVTAINSDGTESAASNAVTATDVVAPSLLARPNGALTSTAVVCGAAATCDLITGKITAITIPFSEQMDKTSATVATNYASTQLGTFSSASYTPATITAGPPLSIAAVNAATVKLTLTTPVDPLPVNAAPFGFITTGANGINDFAATAGDTVLIAQLNGTPNSICVTAAAVGANPVAVAGAPDDVLVPFTATTKGYIHSGPNGVCNTTAAGTDVQTLPLNTGTPYSIAVIPGATGILNTPIVANSVCVRAAAVGATAMTEVPVGDDRFVIGTAITQSVINSGADGICQTTATGTDVQVLPVPTPTSTKARVGLVDDEMNMAQQVVTVTGVTDVAGNAIAGKTMYNADGKVK